jgi:zinc/manganese transport system permease protein
VDLSSLFDPLFRVQLIVGLLAAMVLPLIGTFLRLRDEWLAALGYAHLSAASGLAGLVWQLPIVVGAAIGALLGAIAKSFLGATGNTAYAMMMLVGWSVTLLAAANTPLGESLSHAMIDGQLYFATRVHLVSLGLLLSAVIVALPWLIPRLIRARFFPFHEQANRLPAWRWHLSFDLLAALGMALGTATIGLMAAFSLAFIPPWLAFSIASGWRSTLIWSTALGVIPYLLAFVAAIALDQPFGPVMVVALLLEVPIVYALRLTHR